REARAQGDGARGGRRIGIGLGDPIHGDRLTLSRIVARVREEETIAGPARPGRQIFPVLELDSVDPDPRLDGAPVVEGIQIRTVAVVVRPEDSLRSAAPRQSTRFPDVL